MRTFFLVLALAAACGRTDASLDLALERANAAGDTVEASRLTLVANERQELRAAHGSTGIARVERKYRILSRALAERRDDGSHPRIIPIAYDPRELAAVRDVMTTFGELYVAPTTGEELLRAERPWSGYWYPLSGRNLFEGDAAPLAKLDRLAAKLSAPGGSVAWETAHHEAVPEAAWEGLCGAWAAASILEKEPLRALEYKGIRFSPGDLKGLLTKAHEHFPARTFGVRYDGDERTDGTFQDLRPEAFHRLATHFLGAPSGGLMFDGDPGIAVWNKPLYRFRWVVRQDPEHADAYLVAAFPWFLRFRTAPGDAPTGDEDVVAAAYEYRLYVDREEQQNGRDLVIAGEWTGRSTGNHPDFALVPAPDGGWGSGNPAFTANFAVLRELLEKGAPQ